MEDIIYTLLVIGWIVYGVIKANSKNKKKTITSQKPFDSSDNEETLENEQSPVDALLKGFFNPQMLKEDENTHPYTADFTEETLEKDENPEKIVAEKKLDSYSGSDHTSSVFAHESTQNTPSAYIVEAVDNQSEEGHEIEASEEFNLRQAIIHQVILERPY